MDGGTVNCSLDVPGAVKEETDGLGDCTVSPEKRAALQHGFECMCMHVRTRKRKISDHFTQEVCHFAGSGLIAACIFSFSSTPISWLAREHGQSSCMQNFLVNVKARPLSFNSLKFWVLCALLGLIVGFCFLFLLQIPVNTAVFSMVKNSIL